MLDETSRPSSSHQSKVKKKSSYKRMSKSEWFFSPIARLLSAINTSTVLYFTYS